MAIPPKNVEVMETAVPIDLRCCAVGNKSL